MRDCVFCQVFHCLRFGSRYCKVGFLLYYFHPVVLSEDSSSEEDELERGKKKFQNIPEEKNR